MAEAEQIEAVIPAAIGKPRPWLLIGLSVALVVVGSVAAYAMLALHKARAGEAGTVHAAEAPAATIQHELYLPLSPAFVVNFKDAGSLRYLQVGITLMSHDDAAIQTARDADPVIRDALVSLFSSRDYTTLDNTGGREKLQAAALASVRKIVQARLGRPGIDALYFTSFVMQ